MSGDRAGETVSNLIREIVIKMRARGEAFVRDTGLSPQAAQTIGWIDATQDRGVNQREIAKVSGTTAASVASLVKGLEAGGYIERRPDPNDVRSKLLYVLPKAQAMTAAFEAMSRQAEEELLASLTAAERTTLRRLLVKVNAGFR